MPEWKKRPKRYPRRLTLRYGEKELDRTGFSNDISVTGIFIVAQTLPPPIGSRIHLQLMMDGGKSIFLEGVVRRHKIPPAELRGLERTGFAVRFLTPEELFPEIVPASERTQQFAIPALDPTTAPSPSPETPRPSPPTSSTPTPAPAPPQGRRVDIPFATKEDLQKAYSQELHLGGLFVRTTRHFDASESVVLVLKIEFVGQEHEFPGRVLAITGGGVAFGFDDKVQVQEAILPHLL